MDEAVACLLRGLGKPGEEDKGSKGGRREGAGRLTPAVDGSVGSATGSLPPGEESIIVELRSYQTRMASFGGEKADKDVDDPNESRVGL